MASSGKYDTTTLRSFLSAQVHAQRSVLSAARSFEMAGPSLWLEAAARPEVVRTAAAARTERMGDDLLSWLSRTPFVLPPVTSDHE
jgi:hypothetical protein